MNAQTDSSQQFRHDRLLRNHRRLNYDDTMYFILLGLVLIWITVTVLAFCVGDIDFTIYIELHWLGMDVSVESSG